MTWRIILTATVALGLVSVGIVGGCSKNGDTKNSLVSNGAPQLLSVSPANGATSVDPASVISMKFSMPMDTQSVNTNFHLAGGMEMERWMDSLSHHHGMGGMGDTGTMNMRNMMQWMNSIQYHGQLHWNSTMDSCWFSADSGLTANKTHTMYMSSGVKSHNGQMMVMDTFQYGGYMNHFMTRP